MKRWQYAVRLLGTLGLVMTGGVPHKILGQSTMVHDNTASSAQKPTISTFDAPGAGTGAGQGTLGFDINPSGVIVGEYLDANGVYHGFLRSPDGEFAPPLDAPGAGAGAGEGTQPYSINLEGAITGYYTDATGLSHGFVYAASGAFTSFDAPGAGIPVGVPCTPPVICSNGTQGASIDRAGAIAGQYVGTSDVFHGFVRSPDGAISRFDAPGAGTGAGQGTFVVFGDGINLSGAIVGGYSDTSNVFHGFLRSPDGAITPFDPTDSQFTDPAGINEEGVIAGFYAKATGPYHGFVRSSTGQIASFDVSGAGTEAGQGTETFALNDPGNVVGAYVDTSGVYHGFLRHTDGTITKFDVPGAGSGSGQGTFPVANNSDGAITGWYIDANGVSHGFLRMP